MTACRHSPLPVDAQGFVLPWSGFAKRHTLRCSKCYAVLPLGPAKLDGEHAAAVAIEVRAAEIAAALAPHDALSGECNMSFPELGGWLAQRLHRRGPMLTDGFAAGWLARHIATHKEPTP